MLGSSFPSFLRASHVFCVRQVEAGQGRGGQGHGTGRGWGIKSSWQGQAGFGKVQENRQGRQVGHHFLKSPQTSPVPNVLPSISIPSIIS